MTKFIAKLKWAIIYCWVFVSGLIMSVVALFFWGDTRLNYWYIQLFSRPALWLAGIRVVGENLEEMGKHHPAVYIGNHQSAMDFAFFQCCDIRNIGLVGKKEIQWIPFVGWYFLAAGNLLIDRKKSRDSRARLMDLVKIMREKKRSVGVLPEGTRNKSMDGLLPFKTGAFQLAIEAQRPIIPVVSSSQKNIANWYSGLLRPGVIRVKVLDPVSTVGLTQKDAAQLAIDVREKMLAVYHEITERAEKESGIRVQSIAGLLLMLGLAGCSSTSERVELGSLLLDRPISMRRPPYRGADPTKGPGGIDSTSYPNLPSENWDCEPIRNAIQGLSLSTIRGCLASVNQSLEKAEPSKEGAESPQFSGTYRLRRLVQPVLELQNSETTPDCLKESLPTIPVPRELIFVSRDSEGRLGCYSSRINIEADELLDQKFSMAHYDQRIQFPLQEVPKNDLETERWLLAWVMTPFFKDLKESGTIESIYFPEKHCQRCMKNDQILVEDPSRPDERWPPIRGGTP